MLLIAYFGVYLFAIQSDSFLSLCKEGNERSVNSATKKSDNEDTFVFAYEP